MHKNENHVYFLYLKLTYGVLQEDQDPEKGAISSWGQKISKGTNFLSKYKIWLLLFYMLGPLAGP